VRQNKTRLDARIIKTSEKEFLLEAMPDVVVCFILSAEESSDDGAFCNAFFGLFESNPDLARQALSVQIVCSGRRCSERGGRAHVFAASYLRNKRGHEPQVHVFEDRALGRSLNDAFLWAIASDGAAHWLVWDDAHACTRPFLKSARKVMDGPVRWPLSQLMLEGAWVSALPQYRKVEDDGFRYVLPLSKDSSEMDFIDHAAAETWPGFALSPAWHRLAFLREAVREGYLSLKPFPESSFETWETLQREFGRSWLEAGAVNGELLPSPSVYVDPLSSEEFACPV